jgi:hypothetical protein
MRKSYRLVKNLDKILYIATEKPLSCGGWLVVLKTLVSNLKSFLSLNSRQLPNSSN